jgi:hypothetical protein
MNIEFLATVAVIAPDPINSRNLSRRWVSRVRCRSAYGRDSSMRFSEPSSLRVLMKTLHPQAADP